MMRKLFLTITAVLFGTTLYGQGKLSGERLLTLPDAQALALTHNQSVNKSKILFEQRGYDVEAYKSNSLPRLNLILTDFYSTSSTTLTIQGGHLPIYSWNAEAGTYVPNVLVNADGSYTLQQYADFPGLDMKLKLKNMFIGGVQLTQPIYTGGKISTAVEMAEIGQQMASVQLRLTEDEVILKLDEAYMQAIKAKEMYSVAESYHLRLKELERTVESGVRHGLLLRNDLLKVQVKLNEAELGKQKAENGFLLSRMNLCHLIGAPLTEASRIDVDTTIVHATHLSPRTAGNVELRPEYTLLSKIVDLASAEVKLQRSDYLPEVALFGSAMYANGGELAGKKLMDNGSFAVGVMVKIPLLNFGEGSNKVNSARAKAQMAALELDEKKGLMELEIALCRTKLTECEKEVEIAQKSVTQAEENLRISSSAYEKGVELLSDHLDAYALLRNSQATLVESRCNLYLAYIKLLKATGQLR